MSKLLLFFTNVLVLFSCDGQPAFELNDEKRGEYITTLWEDTSQGVHLIYKGEDLGGMGSVAWLSLEKLTVNGDTIFYSLLNYFNAFSQRASKVYNDTLYLYSEDMPNPIQGWFEIDSSKFLNLEFAEKLPVDTSMITSNLFGEVYKLQNDSLTSFSSSMITMDDLLKEKGIFYILLPGINVKYKYSFRTIALMVTMPEWLGNKAD